MKAMRHPGFANLLGGKLEDNTAIQSKQDAALARRIANASAVPLPPNIRQGEFVVAPLDIMPYVDASTEEGSSTKGKKGTVLEFNGTGYGNITTLEESTLDTIMLAFSQIGESLKDHPDALIVVASSGREDPPILARAKKSTKK